MQDGESGGKDVMRASVRQNDRIVVNHNTAPNRLGQEQTPNVHESNILALIEDNEDSDYYIGDISPK